MTPATVCNPDLAYTGRVAPAFNRTTSILGVTQHLQCVSKSAPRLMVESGRHFPAQEFTRGAPFLLTYHPSCPCSDRTEARGRAAPGCDSRPEQLFAFGSASRRNDCSGGCRTQEQHGRELRCGLS